MILNNEEKKRLVDNLSWMIIDMKYKYDETHQNQEYGSQGGYSPELTSAMELLEFIKRTETIEVTGSHRRLMGVNCREFACDDNRSGICVLSEITLESIGSGIIGCLKCVQAKKTEGKDKICGTL